MKKAVFSLALVGAVSYAACAYIMAPEPSYIEYRYDVEEGDTIWDVAQKIARPEEDVRELVRRIEKDNAIENAVIQPGQELVIRVSDLEKK